MREDFLHYLWRLARFDLRELKTTEGATLSIQNFGQHNQDAGPDFSFAQLRIAGVQWAGNVEIHLKASDWYRHGHQNDPSYNNVVLHVVLEEDRPVMDRLGRRIPCLELKGRIPAGLARSYWRLMHNEYWIPCQTQLGATSALQLRSWLDRLSVERLEKRAAELSQRLARNQRDWENTFYEIIARHLGGRINDEAMDMLARSLPLKIALKHKHSLLQLEALFFGQSGLLPDESEEKYVQQLKREYRVLAQKYSLKPIPLTAWRYLRLRPNNFPTVRIAQLATLIYQSGHLFSKCLAARNPQELQQAFKLKVSNYWRNHYRFGRNSRSQDKRLGIDGLRSLIINAVAPVYFLYGQQRQDERYQERALLLLQELPAERNSQILRWKKLGVKAAHAGDSQALLRLKRVYCSQSKCLECAIGCSILNTGGKTGPPLLSVNEETQLYRLAQAV
ncbi:MAG: DUF2851 family protein [Bacteroidota bacterium]